MCVVAVALYLFRTRPGLNVRAVGESPAAADAMGIDVTRYRYLHTLAGGALAGVGGACFSLALTPQWVDGLTAGAGWIAIALVIFAFWRPDLCLVGAYSFGAFSALPLILQARGVTIAAAAVPGAALRDDDRRARGRLDRDGPAPPRRAGGARRALRPRGALTAEGASGRTTAAFADSAMSLPTAWRISGRSSRRARFAGLIEAVQDVPVLHDLGERAAAVVLADHVLRHALLTGRALEEGREEVLERHRADPSRGRGSGIGARGFPRPLEVRVRDRVAVRVVRREAELLVDPRLELLREDVLEPVGLVVHLVDVDAERLARGTARAGGGGGSPRVRPARPPASASRRGTARGRRARARRASSPSRSRTPGRLPSRGPGPSS